MTPATRGRLPGLTISARSGSSPRNGSASQAAFRREPAMASCRHMSNPRPRSRFDIDLPRVYSQVLGETEAQLAVVRQLGCDSGQGYFFSEAVSPANLVQWLALENVENLEALD